MDTIKVRDVMTSQVATLKPNMGATVALRVLIENRQSGAPVVDDNNTLLGVLSEADCMISAFAGGYYDQERWLVGEKMTQQLDAVNEDCTLVAAAELMIAHKRRMLPVVREGKVVGMITRHHLLKSVLETLEPSH